MVFCAPYKYALRRNPIVRLIADLHIHSRFSRATSEHMDLGHLAASAKLKGIGLLGTGDFTHPGWFAELKQQLKPAGNGLYSLNGILFMPTAEVSCIYSKNGVKRIHLCLCAPSLEAAGQINSLLAKKGNLSADGRPIFGMSAPAVVELVMSVDKNCFVYPAHAWTPWFSVFGSESGFDSMEDCFEDQVKHIHALETGLSSDPPMNWRLSALDKYCLLSNSDSHSPQKIGREANVFEFAEKDISYASIIGAIKSKDKSHFKFTVEFFPEEGKYHWDGHRNCNIHIPPSESRKFSNICPVCRKPLTIGVLHRVEELADRPEGFRPPTAIPFIHAIPLSEIIADAFGMGEPTKAVKEEYDKILAKFGTEFDVLTSAKPNELHETADEKVAEAILRVREGKVRLDPGYDGVYGKISIFGEERKEDAAMASGQKGLGDFF